MSNQTKTKLSKLPNLSIERRESLEQMFVSYSRKVAASEHALRIDRVRLGHILLTLRDATKHGAWLPYLTKLCKRAGNANVGTVRPYIHDAQIATKIPVPVLDEAKTQGFNPESRAVRQVLVNWFIENPDSTETPEKIIKNVLYELKEESKAEERQEKEEARTPEQVAADEAEAEARFKEFAESQKQAQQRERFSPPTSIFGKQVPFTEKQQAIAKELLDAGYRALAQKYHPDKGGTNDQAVTLNHVVAALRQQAGVK